MCALYPILHFGMPDTPYAGDESIMGMLIQLLSFQCLSPQLKCLAHLGF